MTNTRRTLRSLSPHIVASALLWASLHTCPVSANNLASYDFERNDQLAETSDYAPWVDLLRRQSAEQAELNACVADIARCPVYLRGYRSVMLAAAQMRRADQLQLVNRFINRRSWRNQNSWDSHWQPLGTFLRQGGNCKDFAAAKYFMLRALGFSPNEMRVVVAREVGRMSHHALLAVRNGSKPQLFDADNLVYSATSHRDYDFQYSVNETGLWDHKPGL